MPEMQRIRLIDLQPNNWDINRAKLDSVREVWQCGDQNTLPPVDVANIDGGSAAVTNGWRRT